MEFSICYIFMVVLLASLSIVDGRANESKDVKAINTKLLQTIKSYMDLEVNPCEDFYQYACGNWEFVHYDEKKYVDTIGSLEYEANKELAGILDRRIQAQKRETNEVYKKVRDYYETCIEEPEFNIDAYLEVLKPADNQEWPLRLAVATKWQSKDWHWLKTLGRLRSYGLNNVLLRLELKNLNSTDYVLELDSPEQLDFSELDNRQLEMLAKSLSIKDQVQAEKLKIFQVKLKTIVQATRDLPTLPLGISLAELKRRLPGFELQAYFEEFLHEPVTNELNVVIINLAYLRKLNDLVNRTSKETVVYYIMLKLLTFLSKQMPLSNQPHHCVANMREHMSLALDYIYEREAYRFVRNETDAVILNVFHTMQSKFREIIDEHAAELNAAELHFLRRKIAQMQLNIGNLPRHVGDSYYVEYYAQLRVERGYFYWNHLNALQHAVSRDTYLLKLHRPAPEHTFWIWKYPSPAYHQMTNLLLIPFAYLRAPIFHRDFHELFLFAELGNTLGHEILHGFDVNGLKFDARGNPSTLLLNAMSEKPHFQRSLDCLFEEATTSVNEKLADFSGFRLAYESYFHRPVVGKFREETVLTNKQLFFVKFAQFFCAVSPHRIKYDETHDTPFKRVPQAVANYGDFAQEFGCRPNTRMSPRHKCNMW